MARKDPDLNWVPVKAASYPTIDQLIRQNLLKAGDPSLCGPRGIQTLQILREADIQVTTDQSITVAGQSLTADLYRQPTHAYRALLKDAPDLQQYADLEHLYLLVRQKPYWNQREVLDELDRLIKEGRQPLHETQLVVTPTTYQATWQPDETYLRQIANGHWFLGLTYRVTYRPAQQALAKVRVGLDLGMTPMTVAYTSTGETRMFEPTDIAPASRLVESGRLSPPQRDLLTQLLYTSGREDAEKVIAWLNYYADEVTAERLTHKRMNKQFIFVGRDHAIHDHHFSALSQYLNASRMDFLRVNPAGTSQECGHCLQQTGRVVRGNRWRQIFTCPVCGAVRNAHENAAHVVLLRGEQERMKRAG